MEKDGDRDERTHDLYGEKDIQNQTFSTLKYTWTNMQRK
jgi:hypothetical protein